MVVAARRIPAALSWRVVGQASRRLTWGVADSALSSLTNFLLSIYVARTLGAAQFGAFSLAGRETIIRGTAGIITFTPNAVTLQQPAEPLASPFLAWDLIKLGGADTGPSTHRQPCPPGQRPRWRAPLRG